MTNWRKSVQERSIQILLASAIGATVVIGAFLLSYLSSSQRHTRELTRTHQVLIKFEALQKYLRQAESIQRAYVITSETEYLENYQTAKKNVMSQVAELVPLIQQDDRYRAKLDTLGQFLQHRFEMLESFIRLKQLYGADSVKATMIAGNGSEVMATISRISKELQGQTAEELTQSEKDQASSSRIVMGLEIFIIVFSILAFGAALLGLLRELKYRNQLLENLDQQTRELFLDDGKRGADVDREGLFARLIQNMKSATHFITQIGEGHLDVDFEGITPENAIHNQTNLAGSLISMRDRLKTINLEEQNRKWVAEELADMAQILRANDQNIEQLCENILVRIIRSLKANQGAIYLLEKEGEESLLNMKSCYAWERKKYLEASIRPGEGLVGQCFREKDRIYITDLPQNYVSITSGLGGATPSCLLLMPLMVNEEVVGILEVASFYEIKPFQQELITRVCENLASSVNSVNTNQTTRRLLEESQILTEQLRAQEEEMRQNLEELHATQEGMASRMHEYEAQLAEKDEEIARLKQQSLSLQHS